jgi:peptide/nickel transport system permease protein
MLSPRRRRLIAYRVLQVVPVILLVTFFSFLLVHLSPVDPAALLAGENPTPAQIEEVRRFYGLDQPVLMQYLRWLFHVMQGDLSRLMLSSEPVAAMIASKFPATLLVVAYAMLIALAIGAPLGIAAAARPGSLVDAAASAEASFCVAIPYFWVGMVLVLLFAVRAGWFPATGMPSLASDPLGAIWAATLPAIALSLSGIAEIVRQLRAALIEVLNSNYVRTLRAKGLSSSAILWRHGLKNVGITLVTVVGLIFNRKIGATVVIETVFAIPGTGSAVIYAAINKDFAVVQGIILVFALIVVSVNLCTDLAYALLDPRVEE